jgi:hypothetical protein
MGNGEAGILNKPLRVVASPSLKRLPPYSLLPTRHSLFFSEVSSLQSGRLQYQLVKD